MKLPCNSSSAKPPAAVVSAPLYVASSAVSVRPLGSTWETATVWLIEAAEAPRTDRNRGDREGAGGAEGVRCGSGIAAEHGIRGAVAPVDDPLRDSIALDRSSAE